MAELSAVVALATAVAKLSQFLYGQARVLLDVKDDIEWLMGELSWAESFLKDAENKRMKMKRRWWSRALGENYSF